MRLFFFNSSILGILIFFFFMCSVNFYGQTDEKIELKEIEFIGNKYFPTSELEEIIISKESSNWFSQFLESFTSFGNPAIYFDSLNVADDISILKNYYKLNGFFKTQISASYSIDENGAYLVFNIQENSPSLIRNYTINGFNDLPNSLYSDILSFSEIDSTNQFSEELVEINNSRIVNFLQDKGYMLVESSSLIVDLDTLLNVVDITSDFRLGKRYRISEVKVEKSGPGKDLVGDELIEEIANINPEQYYNYNRLKLAQIRLYRTNLFSSAVITGSVADTVGYYVPINIITNVGLLNELSPEIIGIHEENVLKLGLGLSFTKKNFLGGARKLTISTSAAAQNITEFLQEASLTTNNMYGYADARIGIEQPLLFGKTINTKLEAFYTLQKEKNRWNASIYGSKLNLNFELPKYTFLTYFDTYLNWQRTQYIFKKSYIQSLSSESSLSIIDSLYPGDVESYNSNVVLGASFGTNQTDDLLFPTQGYSLSLLIEDGNSIPFASSEIWNYNFSQTAYYKIVFTNTIYFQFLNSIFDAFGAKFKIGNIHSYYGDLKNIPYNQRFTAGGSNSIRGWGANDLPVTEIVLPENFTQNEIENVVRNITPGGFFILEGSIEGRQYISEKIGMALFVDYGNVWNKYKYFRYDELAVAAGFGFRFYSDFAPIRLDFGFKAYDPNDRRGFFTRLKHSPFIKNIQFQIGIGEAF